jgi:glycosyltransferase involved in cell wall biosynthesis
MPGVLFAVRASGTPAVLYAAEIFTRPFDESLLRRGMSRLLIDVSERLASQVVACSRAVAAQYAAAVVVYPGTTVVGVESLRSAWRARLGVEDDELCILCLGNLTFGRGQDVLLRALAVRRTHRVKCVIAGDPHPRAIDHAYAESLRTLVRELGLERVVTFYGAAEEPAGLFAASDLVVNPARFNEPFGRVAIEAFAHGRPALVSRVGAVREVFGEGLSFLTVPSGDPFALASRIEKLAEDRPLRDSLISKGRAHVARRYDEARLTEEFLAILGRVSRPSPTA